MVRFSVSPGWEEVYKIEVEVSGQPIEDLDNTGGGARICEGWIEIWPGLGNPNFLHGYNRPSRPGFYNAVHPQATRPLGITAGDGPNAGPASGVIKIYWSQALQGGERGNGINRVRMFARWPNAKPGAAIRALLEKANNAYLLEGFDREDMEFDGLADVGLYMDSPEPIFGWIERIQAANVIGGQLMLVNDTLRFRLDNPNRVRKLDIPHTDALNHEWLSVQLADDFVHSGWEFVYKKAWDGPEGEGRVVGTNYRNPTADILHGLDLTARFVRPDGPDGPLREYFNLDALKRRVAVIRDMIAGVRHRVTGLEVPMTGDYLELLLFDVVGYLPRALQGGDGTAIDWIVYEKKTNLDRETVTLTLVERATSENWHYPRPGGDTFLVRQVLDVGLDKIVRHGDIDETIRRSERPGG